jgi:hypothetical protein
VLDKSLEHVPLLVEDEFMHSEPTDWVIPVHSTFCIGLDFRLQTNSEF